MDYFRLKNSNEIINLLLKIKEFCYRYSTSHWYLNAGNPPLVTSRSIWIHMGTSQAYHLLEVVDTSKLQMRTQAHIICRLRCRFIQMWHKHMYVKCGLWHIFIFADSGAICYFKKVECTTWFSYNFWHFLKGFTSFKKIWTRLNFFETHFFSDL